MWYLGFTKQLFSNFNFLVKIPIIFGGPGGLVDSASDLPWGNIGNGIRGFDSHVLAMLVGDLVNLADKRIWPYRDKGGVRSPEKVPALCGFNSHSPLGPVKKSSLCNL